MSRINDALKRAKAAQQHNPPLATGLRWRAPEPEPEHAPTRGIGLMLPFGFTLVALLGLFLLWHIWQKHNRQPGTIDKPLAETTSAASVPAISEPVNPPAQTNSPYIPVTPAFKVQAILFAPHNSSAMIDGQTVIEGNQFNGYRVAAITERTVTLVNSTETNVLTLNR